MFEGIYYTLMSVSVVGIILRTGKFPGIILLKTKQRLISPHDINLNVSRTVGKKCLKGISHVFITGGICLVECIFCFPFFAMFCVIFILLSDFAKRLL
jgi:hypothetical protein